MQEIFSQNGINLTEKQLEQFNQLYELFIEWNSKINLSAIRDKEGIYIKHFLDSILATKSIDFLGFRNSDSGASSKLLDLGAGGGFPCLPLAILFPEIEIHALDSVGKKMKAVQDMADQMKLNLKTHHGRIEDFGQDKNYREQFNIVTARALAPWPTLLEYTLPFVKPSGQFIAYQGPTITEDLLTYKNLEQKLGGELTDTFSDSYNSAGETVQRIFVQIKKTSRTLKQYPRLVGEPKKNPLK